MELWEPKRRIEMAFRRSLRSIAQEIIRRIDINADTDTVQRTLLLLSRAPEFTRLAESAALKMVTGLFDDQGRTWRQAAKANMKDAEHQISWPKSLKNFPSTRKRGQSSSHVRRCQRHNLP